MKKARASLSAEEDAVRQAHAEAVAKGLGFGFDVKTAGGPHLAPPTSQSGSASPAIGTGAPLKAVDGMFGGMLHPGGNQRVEAIEIKKETGDIMEEEL